MNLEAWLELLERRHPKSIDMGLGRCGEVYRRMGSPRPAKTVYTVAGTNGKGSTVAYLAAMCSALGQDSLVMEALDAGAKDFIVKPFQPEKVLEVVVRILDETRGG